MKSPDWSLQEAKNRFSAVVDAALKGEVQRVSRRGRPAVVVLSAAEYERLQGYDREDAPGFNALLLTMPQDDGEFPSSEPQLRDVVF